MEPRVYNEEQNFLDIITFTFDQVKFIFMSADSNFFIRVLSHSQLERAQKVLIENFLLPYMGIDNIDLAQTFLFKTFICIVL